MTRSAVFLVAVLMPWASAQTAQERARGTSGAPAAPVSAIPMLKDIFADMGDLLRRADRTQIEVLKARLRESDDELSLLTSLQRAIERGVPIELPRLLRERGVIDATPELLAEHERTRDLLAVDVRVAESKRAGIRGSRTGPIRAPASSPLSAFGKAALDVHLEIPEPPKEAAGTPSASARAVDPDGLGRALYLAKDYPGAMNAFLAVPKEKRSLEVRCLLARCLERLDRWEEAKVMYSDLAAEDPQGRWGELAQWMLRFGGHLRAVNEPKTTTTGGPPKGHP